MHTQEVIAKFDQLRGHEMFIAVMVSLGSAMCHNGNFTRGERMVQKALSEIENNMGKVRDSNRYQGDEGFEGSESKPADSLIRSPVF